ncbi:nucleotidyltransferase family protein [Gemmobacter sp.]|uniref:nucleotidyltransferase family protein n=1 Tax=Gemmobacter sp. TaxID=1898957 RepID=UPI002AFEC5A6|nr:nucleotidyltransferase family protein [Gemmobacter sp.]
MMQRPEPHAQDTARADALIAAWLRGEMPPAERLPEDLLERVFYHGVCALLVARPQVMATLPLTLRDAIRQQALGEAMRDLQHRRILAPLLEDLVREGIRVAVLKGTALACSVYPSPALRPRGDTDLLADPAHVGMIHAILKRHGFVRAEEGPIGPSATVARQG